MASNQLIDYLKNTMSMTEVYQPVILRELLLNKDGCTKAHLARILSEHDQSVTEYYKQVVMRWPKNTLEKKHGIIEYKRKGSLFSLCCDELLESQREEAIAICEAKINEWKIKRTERKDSPQVKASVRYRILKQAKGKCQLCGTPSSRRPIEIDHIVPKKDKDGKHRKNGKVKLHGQLIDVNSEENLQALCFKCNRAKRNTDDTDWRKKKKLVRDKIPDIIRDKGRDPIIKKLSGRQLVQALNEKLDEEHEEYICSKGTEKNIEELADMLEVITALVKEKGLTQGEFIAIANQKRKDRGGFNKGYYLEGYKS